MAQLVEKTYASALFELSLEGDFLKESYDELTSIIKIFDENPDFLKLLTLPTLSFKEKSEVLENVFKKSFSETISNFMLLLIEKNRMSYIIKIADEFKIMYNEHCGILEVEVITAKKLSKTLRTKLVDKLVSLSKKEIILIEKVDSTILGGIILKYNNSMIDSSIKSKLEDMKNHINSIIA